MFRRRAHSTTLAHLGFSPFEPFHLALVFVEDDLSFELDNLDLEFPLDSFEQLDFPLFLPAPIDQLAAEFALQLFAATPFRRFERKRAFQLGDPVGRLRHIREWIRSRRRNVGCRRRSRRFEPGRELLRLGLPAFLLETSLLESLLEFLYPFGRLNLGVLLLRVDRLQLAEPRLFALQLLRRWEGQQGGVRNIPWPNSRIEQLTLNSRARGGQGESSGGRRGDRRSRGVG